jgi:hypothetical protein
MLFAVSAGEFFLLVTCLLMVVVVPSSLRLWVLVPSRQVV